MKNNNGFVIEKKIPLAKSRYAQYPFSTMKVGDSFFIKEGDPCLANASSAASTYGRRKGMKFSRRIVEGGVRFWRVE